MDAFKALEQELSEYEKNEKPNDLESVNAVFTKIKSSEDTLH